MTGEKKFKGEIKMYIKTPKRGILVGIAAVVLSFLLVAGYTAPVLADTEPVLDIGASGTWDDTRVDRACIIKDGGLYKMWYSGHNGSNYQIGYATSNDGVLWEKYSGNPVLTAGSSGRFDEDNVMSPWVIKDGSTYKMWYSGSQTGPVWRIGYATSSDGISWTKFDGSETAQSVLDLGAGFDVHDVFHCTVIKNETDYFEMWYTGNDGSSNLAIGHAWSSDGESWTKNSANPVMDGTGGDSWDDTNVFSPCVIKVAEYADYRMWYSGGNDSNTYKIGRAGCNDGVSWFKNLGPVFSESGQAGDFDEIEVLAPCVINDGGTYKMWYTGVDSSSTNRIGYAISDDGIDWTRVSVPEFQIGSLGFLTMLMLTMGVAVPVTTVLAKKRKRK